jgi:hypothetical protein
LSPEEEVIFTRLEKGPHHDGVRCANGAEVTLQELGPGVKGYLNDALLSSSWHLKTVETDLPEHFAVLLGVHVVVPKGAISIGCDGLDRCG